MVERCVCVCVCVWFSLGEGCCFVAGFVDGGFGGFFGGGGGGGIDGMRRFRFWICMGDLMRPLCCCCCRCYCSSSSKTVLAYTVFERMKFQYLIFLSWVKIFLKKEEKKV